jgi:hypothetical protein
MPLPNIFDSLVVTQLKARIEKLSANTPPQWGKMNAAQMLAHCNVTYELALEDIHPRPSAIQKFFIKLFAKGIVTSDKPYPKNSRTAPVFIVADAQDFATQKQRLEVYLDKVSATGLAAFEGKESHAMGKLTREQWNNMFYKHLDHHLQQFGV